MEFGLYTPLQHINMPEEFAPRFAGDSPFRLARDAVTAADRAGFAVTLVAQRYFGPDLEAWVLAGALAEATTRIRVMPAFHPTFWPPQLIAKMAATLDHVSGGRAALNLVTGWWREEHQMFGGLLLGDEDRYARAEEFVTIMRRLWTEPTVSFKGTQFELVEAQLPLKPLGELPPLYGASRSERGLEMIARSCDWWFVPYPNDYRQPEANLAQLSQHKARMAERAERYGRTLRYAANAFVLYDENEERARRLAEQIEEHGRGGDIDRIHAHGLGMGLIGGKQRILERIAAIEEAGIDLLLLKFVRIVDSVKAFGDEILPGATKPLVPA